jgi:hypothetical protein
MKPLKMLTFSRSALKRVGHSAIKHKLNGLRRGRVMFVDSRGDRMNSGQKFCADSGRPTPVI